MTAPVSALPDEQPPVAPDTPTPALPDRADAPVSEVTERFLRAVIAEVPLELIEELHLFSPLRQGTVETGIAVVATRVPEPEVEAAAAPELPFEEGEETADSEGASEAPTTDALTAEAMTAEAMTAETDEEAPSDDAFVEEDVTADEHVVSDASADESDEADAVSDVPETPETPEVPDMLEAPDAPAAEVPPAPKPVRHTVYTARYRYVIKGPERGKWESNVKAEADAPLITVETVVRGVQRRAGEDSEIVRYTGAQIARALRIPLTA